MASEFSLKTRKDLSLLLGSGAESFIGQTVGVAGWIRTCRVQGKGGSLAFVKLFDGTVPGELQVVMEAEKLENFNEITKGTTGASIFCVGLIVESKGREQKIEMQAQSVTLLGACPADSYPLAKTELKLEYLRTIMHLRARTVTMGSVARIRNCLSFAVHEFFQCRGFANVHTPMITAADCEGAGEMFQVTTLLKHGKLQSTLLDKKNRMVAAQAKAAEAAARTRAANPALEKQGEAAAASEAVVAAPAVVDARTDAELATIADYDADFFGKEAMLTVSGQLNAECYALALSKVYTFGPTFRAENSNTTRHLAEFWMIEPEVAFADINEDMELAEAFIKHTINAALVRCPGDMEILELFEKKAIETREKERKEEEKARVAAEKKRQVEEGKARKAAQAAEAAAKAEADAKALAEGRPVEPAPAPEAKEPKAPKEKKAAPAPSVVAQPDWRDVPLRERLTAIVNSQFARVSYTEAIEIVRQAAADGKAVFEKSVEWGDDMGSEHERYLCERHFKKPTIVINYPKSFKAFYMRANEDGKTVAAMDILVPGVGELIGGSQREERMDKLLEMMAYKGLDPKDFSWYLDLRRFGSVPHAGFGLGFERLVNYTTGMDNIREAIPFPRWPLHAEF